MVIVQNARFRSASNFPITKPGAFLRDRRSFLTSQYRLGRNRKDRRRRRVTEIILTDASRVRDLLQTCSYLRLAHFEENPLQATRCLPKRGCATVVPSFRIKGFHAWKCFHGIM